MNPVSISLFFNQTGYATFILYFLSSFGLAYIMGHSTIMYPLRVLIGGKGPDYVETGLNEDREVPGSAVKPLIPFVGPFLIALFECPACFGFWIGFVSGWGILGFQDPSLVWYAKIPLAFYFGCATSGSNFILGRLTKLI